MPPRDDLKRLMVDDPHLRRVGSPEDITARWLTRSKLTVRSTTGAAAAVQPQSCPAEMSSTAKIDLWGFTPSAYNDEQTFARSSLQTLEEAERLGSPSVWGFVKHDALHLITWLDAVVKAGACRSYPGEGDFSVGTFYVADVAPARRYMEAIIGRA